MAVDLNGNLKILDYAQMATNIWKTMPQEKQYSISRYFHLRPTNSGITIISTIPLFSMRGITSIKDEDTLNKILKKIYKNISKISAVDKTTVVETLKEIGFKQRKSAEKGDIEEDVQALMIQNMSNDENLRIKLDAKNKIQFIASELIFEKGRNRVDIVGFDGVDLFLFELKKDRTTKVDQVKRYVDYYSEPKKLEILKQLLKIYPINPVEEFKKVKGIMVMQYAENSDPEQWRKLALKHSIDILFFEKSLSYK